MAKIVYSEEGRFVDVITAFQLATELQTALERVKELEGQLKVALAGKIPFTYGNEIIVGQVKIIDEKSESIKKLNTKLDSLVKVAEELAKELSHHQNNAYCDLHTESLDNALNQLATWRKENL